MSNVSLGNNADSLKGVAVNGSSPANTQVLTYNSTNGSWGPAAAAVGGGDLKSDGSVAMAASFNLGSNKLINVTDPSSAQDGATKNYVDTVASSLQPIQAATAASTGDYPGAMLANVYTVTATGSIAMDGQAPAANSRVLLKDQVTQANNGVYVVTVTGTSGVSPVLTRASDYNTAAEINAGDLVPVINGTVNNGRSYLQTATIATVNVDALVFTLWTSNIVSLATGVSGTLPAANGGTGTNTSYIQYGVLFASSATQMASTVAGAAGQVLTSNGTTAPTFQSVSLTNSTSTKTATYNATTTDALIATNSGLITINLYGAAGNSGKILRVVRTDNGAGNVTIVGSSANIQGTSLILANQYESASLMCDGTNWQILELRKAPTRSILTSGNAVTYTTPSNAIMLKVTGVGGGGSGGGLISGTGGGGSNGGGGGGTFIVWIPNPLASYTYTVGQGGPGIAGSAGTSGNNTLFNGSTYTANGGTHGNLSGPNQAAWTGSSNFNVSGKAAGGTASGGDINLVGGDGTGGIGFDYSDARPGDGGGTFLSGGMSGGSGAQGAGSAGRIYGGGGAGSCNINNPAGTLAGGNGAAGVIIVEEYYS